MQINLLLKKNWVKLYDYCNLENCKYPGVYLLAYTEKELEGKPIDLADIFYVGMSNSLGGIKQRLRQFISGIERGYGHSGGNRFFKDYSENSPFSKLDNKKRFYVVSISVSCNVNKKERTPEDLRKMGDVTKFEYEVLAYIKEKLEREPELNKK